MNGWSEKWPKEDGIFFFIGGMPGVKCCDEPGLYTVQVSAHGRKSPIYASSGIILWESEGWKGLWKKANMDEFPFQEWRDKFYIPPPVEENDEL